MKYLGLILIASLYSCQGTQQGDESKGDSRSLTTVGNVKDKNGCMTTAGYTWSNLKEECIRPWEGTIALNVTDTSSSYQTAAFILFDHNKQKAELFLKEENESILLDSMAPNLYTSESYALKQDEHCWSVIHNKKTLYEEKK